MKNSKKDDIYTKTYSVINNYILKKKKNWKY